MRIFLFLQILFLVYFAVRAKSVDQELVQKYKKHFQLAFFASLFIYLTETFKLMERFGSLLLPIHHRIVSLYSYTEGRVYTKLFVAQLAGSVYLCIFLSTVTAVLAEDALLLYYGFFLSLLVPLLLFKGLNKQIEHRRQQILLELPELLNQIVLLVNAGETVQQTLIRIQKSAATSKGILYGELEQVVHELNHNTSFKKALEEMSRRCGVQEVSMFTTTVLLNYRRGGNDLVVALRLLSKELWQKRKTVAKTLGEEASSKLVFPMVLLFLVVLLIIATPSILQI